MLLSAGAAGVPKPSDTKIWTTEIKTSYFKVMEANAITEQVTQSHHPKALLKASGMIPH